MEPRPAIPATSAEIPATVDARVLLAGAFGQGNPGDEALLRAFARALPGAELVATSSAPLSTAAEHGVGAVARHDAAAMARTLRAADAVVFAGGTIFKRLHPACGRPPLALLGRAVALAAATKALRKPLALVGVGVGRLDGAAAPRMARALVRAADLLILRDDESAARLADAGAAAPLRVGADAAWALPAPPAPAALPDRRDGPVVVALSHLAGGRELCERLAAGLAPLLGHAPIELQPWQAPDDVELAVALQARLGRGAVMAPPPRDFAAASAGFTAARLVIGLRFHALAAAATAAAPFLAVVHEPKLAGLARRLGQPSVAAAAPPEDVAAAALAVLDAEPAPAAAVRVERERALDGFRLLRVLLARGRSPEAVAVDGLALRPEEWL